MGAWLFLVPLLPLAGSAVLFASLGTWPKRAVSTIGVGTVGLSAAVAIGLAVAFLGGFETRPSVVSSLGGWMRVGGFDVALTLRLDALSLVMILVVTVVGFLIHLYSTVYMAGDEGYSRFFAYMNLFMASMLVLVLGANLLLLYLGWEGVGLCSYLLIGFWYRDPANGYAARKAFVVTRVGDAAMLIGLILLATSFGTLDVQTVLIRASAEWQTGSGLAIAAAALLLSGAVGKSAQLPLQTWLPDAMAGPTPVSALIHAATMVTAGMYLIARTYSLFVLAPPVQLAVGIVGAATLVLAAFSALAQNDIKRVLAYSTMSQIGYMFVALGVGAWSAAVFHFMTHAFFKALLFLAAGAVLLAIHHEQDIRKMGGLAKRMPGVFAAFLVGSAALAAVPVVTSGFYSKEQILLGAWAAGGAGRWLWAAGLASAFLTSVYIFRVVFIAFFGAESRDVRESHEGGGARRPAVAIPLTVLSVLAIAGGFVDTPEGLGHVTLFSRFVATSFPAAAAGAESESGGLGLELAAAAASLVGILVAYLLYFPARAAAPRVFAARAWEAAFRFWAAGWGFDRVYDLAFVRPFVRLARGIARDPVDAVFAGIALSMRAAWRGARLSQTGELRWYAAGMLAGLVVVVAVAIFL
ncbi:MAG TPA: NADH-quinone oxidoreductase subunit L [Gammaproteobacteria bacterium]|nr:NADH-quinone oxidoreductase subunit L [Gammaproteobacteria bacterium]